MFIATNPGSPSVSAMIEAQRLRNQAADLEALAASALIIARMEAARLRLHPLIVGLSTATEAAFIAAIRAEGPANYSPRPAGVEGGIVSTWRETERQAEVVMAPFARTGPREQSACPVPERAARSALYALVLAYLRAVAVIRPQYGEQPEWAPVTRLTPQEVRELLTAE